MTDESKKAGGKRRPAKGENSYYEFRQVEVKVSGQGTTDEDRALLDEISVAIDSLGDPETETPASGRQAVSSVGRNEAGGSKTAFAVAARQKLEEARRRSAAAARKARQKRAGKRVLLFLAAGLLILGLGAVGGITIFKPGPRPEPQKPIKFPVLGAPGAQSEAPVAEPDKVAAPADRPSSPGRAVPGGAPPQPSAEKPNAAAAVAAEAAREKAEAEIRAFLTSWKKTWESSAGQNGRIDPYIAHFSKNFRDGPLDLASWKADKAAKNRRKEWIRIGISHVRISGPSADGKMTVDFLQSYDSSNYSDKTEKTLVLAREGGRWKIVGFGGASNAR